MNTPENRKQTRVPLEVEITLESENNFYSGITGNVSTGGVFVATYTPPPMGSLVQMSLTLNPGHGGPYAVAGRVMWTRGPERASDHAPAGCGIRWVDLNQDAERAIKAFVDHRDSIFYDTDDD
jgi:uncharacterized protein (TIGR02266 family)